MSWSLWTNLHTLGIDKSIYEQIDQHQELQP